MEKIGIAKVDDDVELPGYGDKRSESISYQVVHDTTHRRLKPRHIQLVSFPMIFVFPNVGVLTTLRLALVALSELPFMCL